MQHHLNGARAGHAEDQPVPVHPAFRTHPPKIPAHRILREIGMHLLPHRRQAPAVEHHFRIGGQGFRSGYDRQSGHPQGQQSADHERYGLLPKPAATGTQDHFPGGNLRIRNGKGNHTEPSFPVRPSGLRNIFKRSAGSPGGSGRDGHECRNFPARSPASARYSSHASPSFPNSAFSASRSHS